MSEVIMGQVRFVLVTLCLGMLLMVGYDVLRFVRWIVPHHKVIVALEDIFYWTLVSIPAYVVFYVYNNGEIRWYGALAVFLGGILYEHGISRIFRRFGRKYLEKPKRQIGRVLMKVIGCLNLKKLCKKADEKSYKMQEKKKKKRLQNAGK